MILAVCIMVVLVLFLLAGAIPIYGGTQIIVFHTPVFVLVAGCLVVYLIVCSCRLASLRQAAFLLTHLGAVLILAGAFAGFLAGKQGEVSVPVGHEYALSEIPTRDGKVARLGFDVSVTNFAVERYAPDYALHVPAGSTASSSGSDENRGYTFVKKVRIGKDGFLRLDKHEHLDGAALRNEKGEWTKQHTLSDDRVLQSLGQVDRHYSAALRMTGDDGAARATELTVNHPVEHRGWRFYLMSYDTEREQTVTLAARRDPGRKPVIGGIWALMIGTALLCFRKRGGSHNDD